jgi:hypothetical protein
VSERFYLFSIGGYTLIGLYFEIDNMIYLLSLWLILEAITNIRLTTITQKLLHKQLDPGLTVFKSHQRFNYEASRAWRILVAVMLGGSFLLLNEENIEVVWFFPWFMGFAIMGAGASGVCPMMLALHWAGFR